MGVFPLPPPPIRVILWSCRHGNGPRRSVLEHKNASRQQRGGNSIRSRAVKCPAARSGNAQQSRGIARFQSGRNLMRASAGVFPRRIVSFHFLFTFLRFKRGALLFVRSDSRSRARITGRHETKTRAPLAESWTFQDDIICRRSFEMRVSRRVGNTTLEPRDTTNLVNLDCPDPASSRSIDSAEFALPASSRNIRR